MIALLGALNHAQKQLFLHTMSRLEGAGVTDIRAARVLVGRAVEQERQELAKRRSKSGSRVASRQRERFVCPSCGKKRLYRRETSSGFAIMWCPCGYSTPVEVD